MLSVGELLLLQQLLRARGDLFKQDVLELIPNRFRVANPLSASSVPYIDERCGLIFTDYSNFEKQFSLFYDKVKGAYYNPRNYIIENFKLEYRATRISGFGK